MRALVQVAQHIIDDAHVTTRRAIRAPRRLARAAAALIARPSSRR
jgi:hypothetical protein